VVAACLPDPAHLGHLMEGKTCAGTWVKGKKDGKVKNVYLYQVADNAECMQKYDCQVVVAQTGFNAVIGMELLETGVWKAVGVEGPEAFDPIPFMDLMGEYGFPWGMKEW
jgi:saccharopine dehydrogenase-like NADP-dependent oxidoreductase